MTPEEFKARQAALGLTNRAMSELCGCSETQVERMRRGIRKVNPSIQRVIELEEENRRWRG